MGQHHSSIKPSTVLRYDLTGAPAPSPGNTGATFITAGSGGLDNPTYLTFTETDPTTLAYLGTTAQPTSASPATTAGPALTGTLASALLPLAPVTDPANGSDGWLLDPTVRPRQRPHHTDSP